MEQMVSHTPWEQMPRVQMAVHWPWTQVQMLPMVVPPMSSLRQATNPRRQQYYGQA
jgi:hypothetical protein